MVNMINYLMLGLLLTMGDNVEEKTIEREIVYEEQTFQGISISSFDPTQSTSGYPFRPNCTYQGNIANVPGFENWVESYDYNDEQDYCLFNDSLYITRDVFKNFIGEYFTKTPNDYHISNFLLTEQGNVRNVQVRYEYFIPSYDGVCLGNSVNSVTGFYNSPMYLLVANHQNGFSEEVTFNDAFHTINSEVVCDNWMNNTIIISDFTNDQGSSFSGQSKNLGSLGFEAANIYIRDIEIIGGSETIIIR